MNWKKFIKEDRPVAELVHEDINLSSKYEYPDISANDFMFPKPGHEINSRPDKFEELLLSEKDRIKKKKIKATQAKFLAMNKRRYYKSYDNLDEAAEGILAGGDQEVEIPGFPHFDANFIRIAAESRALFALDIDIVNDTALESLGLILSANRSIQSISIRNFSTLDPSTIENFLSRLEKNTVIRYFQFAVDETVHSTSVLELYTRVQDIINRNSFQLHQHFRFALDDLNTDLLPYQNIKLCFLGFSAQEHNNILEDLVDRNHQQQVVKEFIAEEKAVKKLSLKFCREERNFVPSSSQSELIQSAHKLTALKLKQKIEDERSNLLDALEQTLEDRKTALAKKSFEKLQGSSRFRSTSTLKLGNDLRNSSSVIVGHAKIKKSKSRTWSNIRKRLNPVKFLNLSRRSKASARSEFGFSVGANRNNTLSVGFNESQNLDDVDEASEVNMHHIAGLDRHFGLRPARTSGRHVTWADDRDEEQNEQLSSDYRKEIIRQLEQVPNYAAFAHELKVFDEDTYEKLVKDMSFEEEAGEYLFDGRETDVEIVMYEDSVALQQVFKLILPQDALTIYICNEKSSYPWSTKLHAFRKGEEDPIIIKINESSLEEDDAMEKLLEGIEGLRLSFRSEKIGINWIRFLSRRKKIQDREGSYVISEFGLFQDLVYTDEFKNNLDAAARRGQLNYFNKDRSIVMNQEWLLEHLSLVLFDNSPGVDISQVGGLQQVGLEAEFETLVRTGVIHEDLLTFFFDKEYVAFFISLLRANRLAYPFLNDTFVIPKLLARKKLDGQRTRKKVLELVQSGLYISFEVKMELDRHDLSAPSKFDLSDVYYKLVRTIAKQSGNEVSLLPKFAVTSLSGYREGESSSESAELYIFKHDKKRKQLLRFSLREEDHDLGITVVSSVLRKIVSDERNKFRWKIQECNPRTWSLAHGRTSLMRTAADSQKSRKVLKKKSEMALNLESFMDGGFS
eukprot:snap_masked-scaffold_6-processed-gene-20.38-mRNA-1 protein AED:1.00 eAED:1.00 QI:0/0/0/0/1/1/2/0/962